MPIEYRVSAQGVGGEGRGYVYQVQPAAPPPGPLLFISSCCKRMPNFATPHSSLRRARSNQTIHSYFTKEPWLIFPASSSIPRIFLQTSCRSSASTPAVAATTRPRQASPRPMTPSPAFQDVVNKSMTRSSLRIRTMVSVTSLTRPTMSSTTTPLAEATMQALHLVEGLGRILTSLARPPRSLERLRRSMFDLIVLSQHLGPLPPSRRPKHHIMPINQPSSRTALHELDTRSTRNRSRCLI